MAAANADNTIKIWDLKTGKGMQTLTGHKDKSYISSLAFSPDGKTLASAGDDKNIILRSVTGANTRVLSGHTAWVKKVVFSPDGQMLASSGDDYTIRIWEPKSGKLLKTLKEHKKEVSDLAFSPDSKVLASAGYDKTLILWDTDKWTYNFKIENNTNYYSALAFSPDGRYLVTGDWNGALIMRDTRSGGEMTRASGHTATVRSLSFSPDGRYLVSGSHDKKLKTWSFPEMKELSRSDQKNMVITTAITPDGKMMVCGISDNTVMIYRMNDGAHMGTISISGSKGYVTVVPDGRYDGNSDGVKTINWISGGEVVPLEGMDKSFYVKGLLPEIFGYKIATGSGDDKVDVSRQLIGKVGGVSGKEIIVNCGKTLPMGQKLFIIADGKRIDIEVTFPMMTVAKCRVLKARDLKLVRKGMAVFRGE